VSLLGPCSPRPSPDVGCAACSSSSIAPLQAGWLDLAALPSALDGGLLISPAAWLWLSGIA